MQPAEHASEDLTLARVVPEYRVLLIDDDEVYAELVRRQLRKCERTRFEFDWAPTYDEGLKRLGEDRYDAYLVDYHLGPASGLELIKAGQGLRVQGAMLLLTGNLTTNVDDEALQLGAADYLEKDHTDAAGMERAIRYAVHWRQTQQRLEDVNRRLQDRQEKLRQAHAELRESVKQLQHTQMQLIQAEKLESLGRLAASLAHELKNPLAVVTMGLDYFHKHCAEGTEASVLGEMSEAVSRADGIIRGMLDFSAPMELNQREDDLHEVIEKSLVFVRHELSKSGVEVIRDFSSNVPQVHIDRNKMVQVFINLFMNALHAMPDGGYIRVRTRLRSLAEVAGTPGETHADLEARVLVVEVEDTGPGVPDEQLGKMFDPFYTTKPTGLGTGLGLAVTYSILELHGASIDMVNRPEGGLRVTIRFLL